MDEMNMGSGTPQQPAEPQTPPTPPVEPQPVAQPVEPQPTYAPPVQPAQPYAPQQPTYAPPVQPAQPCAPQQPTYAPPVQPAQPYAPQQPYYGQPVYPPYMQPQDPKAGNGFAVASLILGILSIVCCCAWYFAGIMAILALIFAIVAKKKGNRGLSTAGLVLSIIGLVFFAFLLVGVLFGDANSIYYDNSYYFEDFFMEEFYTSFRG